VARSRHRLSAAAFCGGALLLALGGAAFGADGRSQAAQAASAPPTAAEVRAATRDFLASGAARDVREGPVEPTPFAAAEAAPVEGSLAVALYGAPQLGSTAVGLTSPEGAARRLTKQAAEYERPSELPVIGAIDLIAVIATADRGADGKYRSRQDPKVIAAYLEAAREVGARLMLDIQPGRAKIRRELRPLREWLAQPDVDLAIDPEWNVGPRGVPGRTSGKVRAREANRVAGRLGRVVAEHDLPPKLLVVHQFHEESVRGRSRVRDRDGVEVVLNFDGIGSPGAKRAGYAALAVDQVANGFSLFYRLDDPLMKPAAVLALEPQPSFLLYQ
jgi:hypothetical protein